MKALKKIANILVFLGAILLLAAIEIGVVAGNLYEPYANWILVSSCVCVWLGILFSILSQKRK